MFLWAPFTFNLPETAAGRKSLYQGSILNLQVAFCLVCTVVLAVTSNWAHTSSREVYYRTFAPLIFTAGGILFREFTRRMYFCHMRMKEAFWTDVATVLLQSVGVVWLYRAGKLTVPNTLAILCAGAVVVSLWWVVREWSSFTLRMANTMEDLRLNLRLGRWFLGSNMVSLASMQCNPWVLSALAGGASVGAYAVCESVVNIPRVALTSMQNVMGPMTAKAQAEGGATALRGVVRRADRLLLVSSVGFALVIALVGPSIARLIFRTVPGNARMVLVLLAMNLVAYAATLAPSYGLSALRRADRTFYANAIGVVVQAAVCLVLVRKFQVPGAAAALLIGNSLVFFVLRAFFYRGGTSCA